MSELLFVAVFMTCWCLALVLAAATEPWWNAGDEE